MLDAEAAEATPNAAKMAKPVFIFLPLVVDAISP
jgi:hypothetical protein